ncbi:hypothetical protein BDZ91DRAFT_328019 [Kalaharituber pfeilii]|nr:hypothetical protein BDZ91DRAFT_328019 [Kalaharituber pfeilii]
MASATDSHASIANYYTFLSVPRESWPSADIPTPPPIPSGMLGTLYRQACFLSHPDKNPPPDAVPFHLLKPAYEVLNDPAAKAVYDNRLAERLAKKRRIDERQKRQLEAEEQGRRVRRRQAEVPRRVRKEKKEEEEEEGTRRGEAETAKDHTSTGMNNKAIQMETSQFSDLDRTLMVKLWHLSELADPQLTSKSVMQFFAPFGKVSDCIIHDNSASTTPSTLSKEKEPILAFVVFADIKDAHAVVCAFRRRGSSEARKGSKELWERIQEVKWAGSRGEYWRSPLTLASSGSRRTPGMSMKDYEAVTLMCMREMDHRKFEEEIGRKEGRGKGGRWGGGGINGGENGRTQGQ